MSQIIEFKHYQPEEVVRVDLCEWLERGGLVVEPPRQTLLDDLKDLWADIAAEPGSHLIACFAGLVAGSFGTLGLAFVWSLFL